MTMHLRPRTQRRGGFTLVELLVSVGLTSLLMWGILQLYSTATRFSSSMFTEADLVAGGRACLDRMSSELASAAPLDVGYLKITYDAATTNRCDGIQFAAPIGDGGQLVHVWYRVDTNSSSTTYRMLTRATCTATPTTDAPSDTSYNYSTSAPFGSGWTSLGVKADSLRIKYIDTDSISGTPTDSTGNKSWVDNTGTLEVERLPRAVLIELTVKDVKTSIMVTLSSGAYLAGSGV